MGTLFIYLLGTCFAGVSGIKWENLRVSYGVVEGYYNIPLLKKNLPGDYTLMTTDEDLNVDFYSMPYDPRVSFGYDTYGNIAGIRIGYIKDDVGSRAAAKSLVFPTSLFDNNTMYTSAVYWEQELWYNTVLFVNPEKLKKGGRVYAMGLVAENVYIKIDGDWVVMPRQQTNAESMGFYEQACFIGMGKHYFYNLTTDSKCEELPGIFLLYEAGEMIGLGLVPYGTFTNGANVAWFEDPTAAVAKVIAPNSPACMTDWINYYGTSSLHIFFKKHPRLTFCLGN